MPPGWAESWQRSWDQLEDDLVSDRELRLRVLLDLVEAMVGTSPTVLDLACGPGTITLRLLDRLPRARSIAVDVDPVLLAIASATFADDDRVRIVQAGLNNTAWADGLPEVQFDAVLTATALHWLSENTVRRLYSDLAGLVRLGGVLAHTEQMPLAELPRLGSALAEIEQRRHTCSTVGPVGLTWTARSRRRSTFDGGDASGRKCAHATNISGSWRIYVTPGRADAGGRLTVGPFEDAAAAMAEADRIVATHLSA